jgi:branched-chain amino acid transport system substrate-binding protein
MPAWSIFRLRRTGVDQPWEPEGAVQMMRPGLLVALVLLAMTTSPRAEVLIGLAAPFSGPLAWGGAQMREGAELAIEDLNQAGGVLGQKLQAITADDYCDGAQAVAAARKLIASGVVAVFGHFCSSAAIPASQVYADADLLMISDFATNPQLTEQGFRNVFRTMGRDDVQGRIGGDLLAQRWGDGKIAVLDDGNKYGSGLAGEVKRRLHDLGVEDVVARTIEPGQLDYSSLVHDLQAQGVDVAYYGGYAAEAALIALQAQESGYDLQLVSGDGLNQADFWLIAGTAGEGALFTMFPDPRLSPAAAGLKGRIIETNAGGYSTYAAIQAWAQAVENAGSFETAAVSDALRSGQFDTVLGTIGFDEKGDVTGSDTFVWHVWKNGDYVPVEPQAPTN